MSVILSSAPASFSAKGKLYRAYKVSTIEWAGRVPAHWEIARVQDHSLLLNGYPFESELFNQFKGMPLIRIRDLLKGNTETFYTGPVVEQAVVGNGDVLIGMDGDFNIAWWNAGPALLNQRLCCLRPNASLDKRFLYYLLPFPLQIINELTYATTVKHLSSGQVLKIRLPLPSFLEQRAIAVFLDRETAKIDALVTKKERQIELLREKRIALISQAVTKGINSTMPMKDSGIGWLGSIPEHWPVRRLKHVAKLESGHTPSRQHPEYWKDCTIPWVSLADVAKFRDDSIEYITTTAEKVSELGLNNSSARLLPANTVILSRTASVGFSCIFAEPMATTQDFANWICGPKLRPLYLLYALRSMRQEFRRLIMGSTHSTIYMPDIERFAIPIPPIDEQDAIIQAIRSASSQHTSLISKVQQHIDKLHEYRTALISAAVTGKIDVRGEAS